MTLPKIACICPTYHRPQVLADSIECFNRQTYPLDRRELIILDDGGQYDHQRGPGWNLVSLPVRFRTLGEKRNATAALVSPDVTHFALWDDDDIYLPWHLENMAEVFQAGCEWSKPRDLFINRGNTLQRKGTTFLYHAMWGFSRELFLSVGGYPAMQSGQDQGLLARFKQAKVDYDKADEEKRKRDKLVKADWQSPTGPTSFVYRWHSYTGAKHLSAMGSGGYEKRAKEKIEHVSQIKPAWSRDWAAMARACK
jgi:hypothetical protein